MHVCKFRKHKKMDSSGNYQKIRLCGCGSRKPWKPLPESA